jgi:hypothetical protein
MFGSCCAVPAVGCSRDDDGRLFAAHRRERRHQAAILDSADLGIDGLEKSDSRFGLRPPITETRGKISLVAILGEAMLVID